MENPARCQLNLDRICAALVKGFEADAACIATIRTGELRYVASVGAELSRLPPVLLGDSMIGRILASGRVLASNDLRCDRRCQTVEEAQEMGVAAFLGAPMRDECGEVFGVMSVLKRRPHQWKSESIQSLETIAAVSGIFVANAMRCALQHGGKVGFETVASEVHVIVRSRITKDAFEKAARVASSNSPVLIIGERGTGKEVLARFIHAHSRRRGSFIAFNCAAVPEGLFEAELFGHVRGAFTGATTSRAGAAGAAAGGTLFLDEIGDLSTDKQGKLLRLAQDMEFKSGGSDTPSTADIRIIAATNKDIRPGRASTFREELYDRLARYTIKMPPLRERREELELLIARYTREIPLDCTHPVAGIAKKGMQLLRRYQWPGNIRELCRVLSEAFIETPPGHFG